MTEVVLSLGSNVGDGRAHLRQALEEIEKVAPLQSVSSIFRSRAMYVTDQPDFLNAAAVAHTDLGPWPLLQALKSIERDQGRVHRYRWGPREIDIDIVTYGSLLYRFVLRGETVLELPHPRAHERRFVLEPLAEICPRCIIPGKGRAIDLLAQTEDQSSGVVKESHELLSVRSPR